MQQGAVCRGIVKHAVKDKFTQVAFSLWIELEPGIQGELHRTRIAQTEHHLLATDFTGKNISVRVTGMTNGKLLLETVTFREQVNTPSPPAKPPLTPTAKVIHSPPVQPIYPQVGIRTNITND